MMRRRQARPAAASSPSVSDQDPQPQSPVGKLSQTMNEKRPKKKGFLHPRKSAVSLTH